MAARPRIALVTSDERRHRYVANVLHEHVELAAVFAEAKAPPVPQTGALANEAARKHLLDRDQVEARLLFDQPFPAGVNVSYLQRGQTRDPAFARQVEEVRPDLVVLYGSGIVGTALLDLFPGGVVNMHLGLSPWYRGSATNFWPLVEGQPEGVGVTIHLAVAKVDAGPIIHQVRPDMARGDRAHEIGTKSLMAGTRALAGLLPRLCAGAVRSHAQDLSLGRVFRKSQYGSEAVEKMWRNFEDGMIETYLDQKPGRDRRMPLVEAT